MTIIISGGRGNTFSGVRVGGSSSNIIYFRCKSCGAQASAKFAPEASIHIHGKCPFCGGEGCVKAQINGAAQPKPDWFDPSVAIALPPGPVPQLADKRGR